LVIPLAASLFENFGQSSLTGASAAGLFAAVRIIRSSIKYRVQAATTRGPGSTESEGCNGLLSIVTSVKPTAFS
jgi:hypothetical protein